MVMADIMNGLDNCNKSVSFSFLNGFYDNHGITKTTLFKGL